MATCETDKQAKIKQSETSHGAGVITLSRPCVCNNVCVCVSTYVCPCECQMDIQCCVGHTKTVAY